MRQLVMCLVLYRIVSSAFPSYVAIFPSIIFPSVTARVFLLNKTIISFVRNEMRVHKYILMIFNIAFFFALIKETQISNWCIATAAKKELTN